VDGFFLGRTKKPSGQSNFNLSCPARKSGDRISFVHNVSNSPAKICEEIVMNNKKKSREDGFPKSGSLGILRPFFLPSVYEKAFEF
jgi:hypothetical protein